MTQANQKKWWVAASILATLTIFFTACSSGGDSDAQQSGSSLVDTGQSQSGSSASTSTPVRSAPTASEDGLAPEATAQPGAPANVRVPNDEVTMDNLTITVSVQAARRMVASNTSPPGVATPQPQQGQSNQGAAAVEEMILGVQTQQINKNLDAAQGPPPDPKDDQGDFIRNVAIQVRDSTTGQVVPYLVISMDILKDGRPVRYDQALVPAVPQGESVEQMHYTNNVVFPGKGRYQLFVRIQPSPVLGNSSPPSMQFEVIIE